MKQAEELRNSFLVFLYADVENQEMSKDNKWEIFKSLVINYKNRMLFVLHLH